MLTEKDKFDLRRAYKDAAAKTAQLAARMRDEYQQAEADNREPIIITPLTALPANLVVAACEAVKECPDDLRPIVDSQKNACEQLENRIVYLLSEQMKAILEAAGFGGTDALV